MEQYLRDEPCHRRLRRLESPPAPAALSATKSQNDLLKMLVSSPSPRTLRRELEIRATLADDESQAVKSRLDYLNLWDDLKDEEAEEEDSELRPSSSYSSFSSSEDSSSPTSSVGGVVQARGPIVLASSAVPPIVSPLTPPSSPESSSPSSVQVASPSAVNFHSKFLRPNEKLSTLAGELPRLLTPSRVKRVKSKDDPCADNRRRIHKCNFPDCRKVYTKSSHLKAHQRTHTGRRSIASAQLSRNQAHLKPEINRTEINCAPKIFDMLCVSVAQLPISLTKMTPSGDKVR